MADHGTRPDAETSGTAADSRPAKALTTDAVLCAEALAIHGAEVSGEGPALYAALYGLKSNALCLSGGGIRSASFALGIIQALAAHPRPSSTSHVDSADNSFLAKFHYLSTVSGGGYIGGWLSAGMTRAGLPAIWSSLVGRPDGPDVEPPIISWLRAYSNFLTPKLGVMSADSWAAVALVLRNMLLNWLVILPVLCAGLVLLKLYAMAVAWFGHCYPLDGTPAYATIIIGVLLLLAALCFTHSQRPAHCKSKAGQGLFLACSLLPALLAGVCLSFALALPYVHDRLYEMPWFSWSPSSFLVRGIVSAAAVYLLAWAPSLLCWQRRELRDIRRDFVAALGAGITLGVLIALGAYLYMQLWPVEIQIPHRPPLRSDALLVIFAVPWMLFAMLVAEMIFVGLSCYEKNSDADREWLGRAAGWYLVAALGWAIVMFLVFVGSILAEAVYQNIWTWLTGGVTGRVGASLAKSRATPAKGSAKDSKGLSLNMVAMIAAIVFAVILVILASALLDKILIGGPLLESADFNSKAVNEGWPAWPGTWWLPGGLAVSLLVTLVTSYFINVNRFSLHALYRNRLIRAFLGASHAEERRPNPFTDFDDKDNLRMVELWPPQAWWDEMRGTYKQPFHIVNMALNIVSTKRLAWQERKAESFTVSPLHSGSACGGVRPKAGMAPLSPSHPAASQAPPGAMRAYGAFRPSEHYGADDGITLGTAVAISGAAASPNMGYNSSPPLAFLMTMFNVRLGWWLGNPEMKQTIYESEGPHFAIKPLLSEMFGLTDDTSNYVYLSDGGHFENLALYEMARRRCRFIVVSDAGCDPDFTFEDLGNAVRKIALDLGVTITFHGVSTLRTRAEEERQAQCCKVETKEPPKVAIDTPLCAIGTIDYGPGQEGVVLYVKAAYHRAVVKNVGVRSYAIANPTFPHQSTGDQFFSESQFESYRALGFELMDDILRRGTALLAKGTRPTLEGILTALHDHAVKTGLP